MGFDTSHHPIDLELVHRAVSYVAGEGEIDDLVADAVRRAKTRFRANAWGLGVFALGEESAAAAFEPGLHLWGRPYFITVTGAEAIASMLDRYLAAASDEEVDALARENLAALHPSLPSKVTPSAEGVLPSDADLARLARGHLDLLRAARESHAQGASFSLPSGKHVDPGRLLARELSRVALTFAASARPGWMDRGEVFPSRLFEQAGIDAGELFEPPRALLGSLVGLKIDWFLERTITENFMVGASVAPANVPRFCALLDAHRARLEGCFRSEDDDKPLPEVVLSVQKLIEAANDARLRGLGFAEATEVYSGFEGVLN